MLSEEEIKLIEDSTQAIDSAPFHFKAFNIIKLSAIQMTAVAFEVEVLSVSSIFWAMRYDEKNYAGLRFSVAKSNVMCKVKVGEGSKDMPLHAILFITTVAISIAGYKKNINMSKRRIPAIAQQMFDFASAFCVANNLKLRDLPKIFPDAHGLGMMANGLVPDHPVFYKGLTSAASGFFLNQALYNKDFPNNLHENTPSTTKLRTLLTTICQKNVDSAWVFYLCSPIQTKLFSLGSDDIAKSTAYSISVKAISAAGASIFPQTLPKVPEAYGTDLYNPKVCHDDLLVVELLNAVKTMAGDADKNAKKLQTKAPSSEEE